MKARRRGIYLISTLLLLTFLVIVGGAVMVSFQQGIASSGSFNNRQMATQAAMSGLHYLQARLETNVTNYSPSAAAGTPVLATSDGAFQVKESGLNVCGMITNGNVAGTGESQIYLLWRASFNADYNALSSPQDWSFATFNGTTWKMGSMPWISMNNLNRSTSQNSASYKLDGTTLQTIPGGMADIVVEGMAVSPSGNILARRTIECMVSIQQIGSISGAANAAGDMNLTVTQSGGKVTVGAVDPNAECASKAGLAALNDISIYGADAPSSSNMPNYSADAQASLKDTTKHFYYVNGGSASDFTAQAARVPDPAVKPPGLPQTSLPAPASPAEVTAGTWVVWNGTLYHYPTEYSATDGSGKSIPIASQSWDQPDPAKPPKYNGVATDTPAGMTSLDAGGRLALSNDSNTITVAKNVAVAGSGSVNAFALVVAPSSYTKGDGSTGTISSPNIDSSAKGSAQIVFDGSTDTPQFRSGGSITVMGNVTGQGSLVSLGRPIDATGTLVGSGSSVGGNITVVGKSSLDTRSDSGIALYAAGNLNLLQLSDAQAPSAVPDVNTSLEGIGVKPGSGGKGTATSSGFTSAQDAVNSVIAQALKEASKHSSFVTYDKASDSYTVSYGDKGFLAGLLMQYGKDVHVTYNGEKLKGPITSVLSDITGNSDYAATYTYWGFDGKQHSTPSKAAYYAIAKTAAGSSSDSYNGLSPTMSNPSYWDTQTHTNMYGGEWYSTTFKAKTLQNYIATGTPSSTTPSPTPTSVPPSNGDPTPTPTPNGQVVQGALDQSFSGLVYAGKSINMTNELGNISLSGAMVAYGADPSAASPGTDGGNINISGSNVTIQYDPTMLGPYAQFLGGRVVLKRTCLSAF